MVRSDVQALLQELWNIFIGIRWPLLQLQHRCRRGFKTQMGKRGLHFNGIVINMQATSVPQPLPSIDLHKRDSSIKLTRSTVVQVRYRDKTPLLNQDVPLIDFDLILFSPHFPPQFIGLSLQSVFFRLLDFLAVPSPQKLVAPQCQISAEVIQQPTWQEADGKDE